MIMAIDAPILQDTLGLYTCAVSFQIPSKEKSVFDQKNCLDGSRLSPYPKKKTLQMDLDFQLYVCIPLR